MIEHGVLNRTKALDSRELVLMKHCHCSLAMTLEQGSVPSLDQCGTYVCEAESAFHYRELRSQHQTHCTNPQWEKYLHCLLFTPGCFSKWSLTLPLCDLFSWQMTFSIFFPNLFQSFLLKVNFQWNLLFFFWKILRYKQPYNLKHVAVEITHSNLCSGNFFSCDIETSSQQPKQKWKNVHFMYFKNISWNLLTVPVLERRGREYKN